MLRINYPRIGRRIQEIRKMRKMSQADLAEYTNMSVSYISHIETSIKKASLESLVRIANVLGVTVDQLLNGNQVNDRVEYSAELAELLSDCNSCEKRILFEVAIAVKNSLRENEWMIRNDEHSEYYY